MQELEGSGEMLQSLTKMRQYVRSRGEFLRSASHDLRSSVGVILGATALLDIIDTEESRARTLSMIQRNLRQVAEMMNQLLDFSRLESGNEKMKISEFDASELLSELCESVIPIANEKGLEITCEGTEMLLCEGDIVKIRRIAQNLMVNAIRYTDSGKVSVFWDYLPDTEKPGDDSKNYWYFTITDTGAGIAPDKISEITLFNPQVGNGIDTESLEIENTNGVGDLISSVSGEGIGLYIVKRLCEVIGAKMEVVSKSGEGTMFKIIVPISY